MKILVVDDSDLERELLVEILKGSGVENEFLHAKSGEEAINLLGTNFKEIGMILLDWQMPEMNGIEFMEGVVKVPAVARIPIVMVTASGTEENKKKARDVNPNLAGYVVKPYDPDELVKIVKTIMNGSSSLNES